MGNAVRDSYMELTVSSFYLQTYPEQSGYFRACAQHFSVTQMRAEEHSAIVPWFRVPVYFCNSSS